MSELPSKPAPTVRGAAASESVSEEELRKRLGVAGVPTLNYQTPKPAPKTRILEGIKTFMWVAPLTVLIWIYAEREQRVQVADVRVPIQVVTNSPDRVLTDVGLTDKQIFVDLDGPRASVERIRDVLTSGRPQPVEIVVPASLKVPFSGALDGLQISDQLNRNDLFVRNAVKVTKAPPIEIKLEAMESRSVPVRASADVVGTLSAFDPPSVLIQGPTSAMAALSSIPEGQLYAVADTGRFANRAPGVYANEVIDLSLSVPAPKVRLVPATVRVTATIKKAEPYMLKGAIPISVELPLTLQNSVKIETSGTFQDSPTIPGVSVTGTRQSIEQLESGKFKPKAVLVLSREDLEPGQHTKEITADNFKLPPDVTVTSPAVVVQYTVTRTDEH